MPGAAKEFEIIYKQATRLPYSYLCVDVTQTCIEDLRFRANIFPGEEMRCWVHKDRVSLLQNL